MEGYSSNACKEKATKGIETSQWKGSYCTHRQGKYTQHVRYIILCIVLSNNKPLFCVPYESRDRSINIFFKVRMRMQMRSTCFCIDMWLARNSWFVPVASTVHEKSGILCKIICLLKSRDQKILWNKSKIFQKYKRVICQLNWNNLSMWNGEQLEENRTKNI